MCTLLNVATIGGVLACLLRHFRASLASLPLLGQPLGRLPVSSAGSHHEWGTHILAEREQIWLATASSSCKGASCCLAVLGRS